MLINRLSRFFVCGGMNGLAWRMGLVVALSATLGMAQEKPTGPEDQASSTVEEPDPSAPATAKDTAQDAETQTDGADKEPCVTDQKGPCTDQDKIPRFVVNSPFDSSKPTTL